MSEGESILFIVAASCVILLSLLMMFIYGPILALVQGMITVFSPGE
jgi:hypothetical protein